MWNGPPISRTKSSTSHEYALSALTGGHARFRSARGARATLKLTLSALPLTLTLTGALSPAQAADDDTSRQQAIVHFNAGNQAFSAGDTHTAYREYRTAWKLNRAFDIACNLGRAEAELGKLTDAADHLAYCLDNFSASPQPELRRARQRYEELFRTVTAQVSRVDLFVEPAGAEILIDGVHTGEAPLQTIYLTPGEHSLEVRKAKYRSLEQQFAITAGENRRFELELESLADTPHPATKATRPHAPESPPIVQRSMNADTSQLTSRHFVLLGGAALTMASGGVGLGFYLQSKKLEDEASELRQTVHEMRPDDPSQACVQPSPTCRRLADTVERQDRARNVATGGFIAMGVLGVGTLASWLLWRPGDDPDTATTISPWMDRNSFGAMIRGTL